MNREQCNAVGLRVANGDRIAERVRVADDVWSRLRGLLGMRSLPPRSGVWIVPCRSIHTIGMRFSIDVVFLDAEYRVLRTVNALRPWRMCFSPRRGHSVIELPAGVLRNVKLDVGDRVQVLVDPSD